MHLPHLMKDYVRRGHTLRCHECDSHPCPGLLPRSERLSTNRRACYYTPERLTRSCSLLEQVQRPVEVSPLFQATHNAREHSFWPSPKAEGANRWRKGNRVQ